MLFRITLRKKLVKMYKAFRCSFFYAVMQDVLACKYDCLPSLLAAECPSRTHIFWGGDVSLSVMAVAFIYRLISQRIFLSAVFPGADDIGVTLHFIDSSCRCFLLFLCHAFPPPLPWDMLRMKESYSCWCFLPSFCSFVLKVHHGV